MKPSKIPRVALCLSGQARAVKFCYSSIYENIIQPFGKVDVFIHTWNIDKTSKENFDTYNRNVYDCTIEEYLDLYKPTSYLIEDFSKSPLTVFCMKVKKYKIMHYAVQKSNDIRQAQEKKHGFKYDYVIRCRTDLRFARKITLPEVSVVGDNTVLIPIGMDNGGYNDQFAVGNSISMNKYASIYDFTSKEHKSGPYSESQNRNAECYLKHHIQNIKLGVKRFDFDYDLVKYDYTLKKLKFYPA